MRRGERAGEPLLVAEAGEAYRALPEGDPVAAWLDLLEAVEALAPASSPAPEPLVLRDCRL